MSKQAKTLYMQFWEADFDFTNYLVNLCSLLESPGRLSQEQRASVKNHLSLVVERSNLIFSAIYDCLGQLELGPAEMQLIQNQIEKQKQEKQEEPNQKQIKKPTRIQQQNAAKKYIFQSLSCPNQPVNDQYTMNKMLKMRPQVILQRFSLRQTNFDIFLNKVSLQSVQAKMNQVLQKRGNNVKDKFNFVQVLACVGSNLRENQAAFGEQDGKIVCLDDRSAPNCGNLNNFQPFFHQILRNEKGLCRLGCDMRLYTCMHLVPQSKYIRCPICQQDDFYEIQWTNKGPILSFLIETKRTAGYRLEIEQQIQRHRDFELRMAMEPDLREFVMQQIQRERQQREQLMAPPVVQREAWRQRQEQMIQMTFQRMQMQMEMDLENEEENDEELEEIYEESDQSMW